MMILDRKVDRQLPAQHLAVRSTFQFGILPACGLQCWSARERFNL